MTPASLRELADRCEAANYSTSIFGSLALMYDAARALGMDATGCDYSLPDCAAALRARAAMMEDGDE